jgi:hypothetical protein
MEWGRPDGTGRNRSGADGLGETAGTIETGSRETDSSQTSACKVGLTQVCIVEVCLVDGGRFELGLIQPRPSESRLSKFGPPKVCFAGIYEIQVGFTQIGPPQIDLAEVGASEVCII